MDKNKRGRPKVHFTEEDRKEALKKSKTKYMLDKEWYCDICNRKYSLKRKDKHLLTKVHKKNKERSDREEELEEYMIRRDILLSENIADMDFDTFVKKRKLVDKQLKKEFGRNYKVPE